MFYLFQMILWCKLQLNGTNVNKIEIKNVYPINNLAILSISSSMSIDIYYLIDVISTSQAIYISHLMDGISTSLAIDIYYLTY